MAEIFLVRQPVFDRSDAAMGYELRFRDSDDGGDAFARSYVGGSFDVLRAHFCEELRALRRDTTAAPHSPVLSATSLRLPEKQIPAPKSRLAKAS
jgi:hypothetical protein